MRVCVWRVCVTHSVCFVYIWSGQLISHLTHHHCFEIKTQAPSLEFLSKWEEETAWGIPIDCHRTPSFSLCDTFLPLNRIQPRDLPGPCILGLSLCWGTCQRTYIALARQVAMLGCICSQDLQVHYIVCSQDLQVHYILCSQDIQVHYNPGSSNTSNG